MTEALDTSKLADKLIIEELKLKNSILSSRLFNIRSCEDLKCTLCARCMDAIAVDRIEVEPPEFNENDPIRNTGHRSSNRWNSNRKRT